MRKLGAKLTRSAIANTLGAAGGVSLTVGAWHWNSIAGLGALGVVLLVAGWAVDE